MKNKVISENPFGALTGEGVLAFEKTMGVSLPFDYRSYLLRFNGGDFEKNIVRLSEAEGKTRVQHMYGVHNGPAYARLSAPRRIGGQEFLAICDDANGNQFLVKLGGKSAGSVYFLDHEKPRGLDALITVAPTFDEFINKMQSSDESLLELQRSDPEAYDEFQKQLRGEEVARRKTPR